jgi:hypothetical protein
MRCTRWFVLGLGLVLACGKSSEQKTESAPSVAPADSTPAARSALAAMFAARGLRVVEERDAPTQRSGRTAAAVVYRTADGGRGGVVYLTKPIGGTTERIGWHWYFSDGAPDSVVFAEINRDGLWDARVFTGGRSVDLIQGESFLLLGREKRGRGALNGPSSAPAELWKCFDGDSATAWRSPKDGAFIEIPCPLGVESAELDVQLAPDDQPERLDVYADDRKLQSIDLSGGIARQSFPLDPAVREAATVRIEVRGGRGDSVAISELEIR